MIITHTEYMDRFNKTKSDLSPFKRHLDACGINVKMDKSRRSRKFLWGKKTPQDGILWVSLDSLSLSHLASIKTYLANYAHSFEDEQIGWVFDLVDYTINNFKK